MKTRRKLFVSVFIHVVSRLFLAFSYSIWSPDSNIKKSGSASQMSQKRKSKVMGRSEEVSVQKRRMVCNGTDERRSSIQGRSSENMQENIQATVSEDIRALHVEEEGKVE